MKVFIGKYKNYFTKYYFTDKLYNLGFTEEFVDKVAENKYVGLTLDFICNVLNKLLQTDKRSIKVKIHDYDVWSMDYTLAFIILPMLIKLKESKQGTPNFFCDDRDEEVTSDKTKIQFEYKGISEKNWDEALDKMIWSFNELVKENSGNYTEPYWEIVPPEDEEEYLKRYSIFDSKGEKFLIEDKPYTRINSEKYQEYNRKLLEGFELFGKHYMSLWS